MSCNIEARCGRSARRASIRSHLYCIRLGDKGESQNSGRAARRVVSLLAEFRAGLDLIHFASLNALTLDEAEPLPRRDSRFRGNAGVWRFSRGIAKRGRLALRLRDHYDPKPKNPRRPSSCPRLPAPPPHRQPPCSTRCAVCCSPIARPSRRSAPLQGSSPHPRPPLLLRQANHHPGPHRPRPHRLRLERLLPYLRRRGQDRLRNPLGHLL